MNRRDFIRTSTLGAATLASLASRANANTDADRPNILWLISEDTSPDLACYGTPCVKTPNLDRLASQGTRYTNAFVTAPVRCAPPGNQPTPVERDTCSAWFDAELDLLPNATVFVVLGQFAFHAMWSHLRRRGVNLPRPRPAFRHGDEIDAGGSTIVMSYHVSQQNTFTGRLTEPMLEAVFARATERAAGP